MSIISLVMRMSDVQDESPQLVEGDQILSFCFGTKSIWPGFNQLETRIDFFCGITKDHLNMAIRCGWSQSVGAFFLFLLF